MKGSYNIKIEAKRIKYELRINRNITIIQGDSATGKTTLVKYVDDYYNEGKDSGIKIECNKTCIALKGKNWQRDLDSINDCIVFIDEGNKFVKSSDFAEAIKHTDNYYVIITREDLDNLPYSVHEIYGLRTSGRTEIGKPVYNEMFRLYGEYAADKEIKPRIIITEDDKSGYQFFESVCRTLDILCEPAKGKTKIKNFINDSYAESTVLIVADGAAFGAQMREIMEYLKIYTNYVLFLPESFEWIVLKSGIFNDKNLEKILSEPSNYIDSVDYFSWERYFTALLEKVSEESSIVKRYNKSKLDTIYKNAGNARKILKQMNSIRLE